MTSEQKTQVIELLKQIILNVHNEQFMIEKLNDIIKVLES